VIRKALEKMIDIQCNSKSPGREYRERGLGNYWWFLKLLLDVRYQQTASVGPNGTAFDWLDNQQRQDKNMLDLHYFM
jgi:hypothetical protein